MSRPEHVSLDVRYVARLARLELSPDEADRLQEQLGHVLEHVRKLEQVDVSGVEPTTYSTNVHVALRTDAVRPSLDHDEVMRNAPAQADGLFSVPPIIE